VGWVRVAWLPLSSRLSTRPRTVVQLIPSTWTQCPRVSLALDAGYGVTRSDIGTWPTEQIFDRGKVAVVRVRARLRTNVLDASPPTHNGPRAFNNVPIAAEAGGLVCYPRHGRSPCRRIGVSVLSIG
jgi:hypothetical protein